MKKTLLTVLLGIFAFSVGHAQGISGKWKADLESPQGNLELNFTFKVEEAKLTGAVSSPMGSQEITNGKVNGNEFSYDIDMMGNTMTFKGKLEKENIKLTIKMPEDGSEAPRGPGEMTLTRVE